MERASAAVAGRGRVLASDAERERCCRTLRQHYAAGRIDHDELEERLERATRARTRGDLRRLTYDLPRAGAVVATVDRANRVLLRAHATGFTALNGGLVGAWAATGEGWFWPGLVLAPTAALLGSHAGATYAGRRLARRVRRR